LWGASFCGTGGGAGWQVPYFRVPAKKQENEPSLLECVKLRTKSVLLIHQNMSCSATCMYHVPE